MYYRDEYFLNGNWNNLTPNTHKGNILSNIANRYMWTDKSFRVREWPTSSYKTNKEKGPYQRLSFLSTKEVTLLKHLWRNFSSDLLLKLELNSVLKSAKLTTLKNEALIQDRSWMGILPKRYLAKVLYLGKVILKNKCRHFPPLNLLVFRSFNNKK